MKLSYALNTQNLITANAPIGTRLKYDYGFNASYDLTHDEHSRKILIDLLKGDALEAAKHNTPIILNAATYRANRNHLEYNGISAFDEIERVNINNLKLVIELVNELGQRDQIIIGAPLGSMFDAYSTYNTLDVYNSYLYHKEQIDIFQKQPIDFINAVTLPTLPEATGIAMACDESNIEYTVGFILTDKGLLLDGTSLKDAIIAIDNATRNKPVGYMVTCTHASVLKLIDLTDIPKGRLIGLQANGSCLKLSDLEKLDRPLADEPAFFADELDKLKKRLKLLIISGCCGTTRNHLSNILEKCS